MTTTLPGHQVLAPEPIDRITDEVYNSLDSSKKDLYNLSLTSRDVGKRATALIFRVVKLKGGASESDLENDVSRLRVLFESNRNLATLVKVLVLDDPEQNSNTSSPNLLFVLGQMQKLTIIKMLGIESRPPRRGRVSFFTTFASRTSLTDIRLYDMFMKYHEFETILRSSPALTSLLISNLDISEFPRMYHRRGMHRGVVMMPEAVAWEDPKSRYRGLQPQKALNLPIERLIMRLSTSSDYGIMDLFMSSRLPIFVPGRLKNLAISYARGSLNKAITDRIAAFLESPLTQSVSRLHLGEHEGDEYRWGPDSARNLDTVRLPLCEALELHLIFFDWHTFGVNDAWIANMLETISPTQLPVRKLLLVFDFRFFRGHMVSNLPTPDELWVGLDNALCAHHFDLEEIGIHIIFSVEDPNNELEIDNPYEERIVEEEEAEESDGSESEVEESGVASGEDESDMESDEESDPDDSIYTPNQSEYTDAEDEDDVELEKKDDEDDDAKGQDHKDTPGHILQHWLLGFALPKTNTRYHFQQDQTNVSASENGVKSWIRLSERTNKNELIFDIDEVLRRT